MQTEKGFKHVTNRQGVRLMNLAREAGISREKFSKFLNDDEKKKNFFDELKNGDNWFEKLQTEAEKIGARVHLLRVKVDYTKTHKEAAMAGAPQTDSRFNLKVLEAKDKYQLLEKKEIDEVIILFNWINGGGSYSKAINFGFSNGLKKSNPHEVFAIGEQFTNLNYTLITNPMCVVETTGCSVVGDASACYVCFDDVKRYSHLNWQTVFGRCDNWFAFRKL